MQERNEAKDASVLVFGRFLAVMAQALIPFVIVRLLGKADVGAFSGLMLIYATVSVLFTAGFPAAVLYYLAGRDLESRAAVSRRLFRQVVALGFVVGLILYAVGLYGDDVLRTFGQWMTSGEANPDQQTDLSHLLWFSIFPIFDVCSRVFPNFLIAENDSRGAAVFGFLRAIGMTMGTLVPAAMGYGVPGIIAGLTVFAVLQAAYMYRVYRRKYRAAARVPCDVSVREMVKFAYPIGLTDIVSNLNAAVDRYTILFLMTASAFAEYRCGAWQLPITFIAYSVGHVYMPRFVELAKAGKGAEVIALWRTAIHKVSLIVVPVCVVFVVGSEEFVRLAFTDEYLAAVPIFRIYVIVTMTRVASYGAVILAAGKSIYLFRAAAFTLGSNLALTVPLALTLGFIGPALGTALALIPTIAVYCWYISKALEVPIGKTVPVMLWLKIVALAGVSAGPAIAFKLLVVPHPLVGLVAYGVSTAALFILLGRLTGLMSKADLDFGLAWLKLKFLRLGPKESGT